MFTPGDSTSRACDFGLTHTHAYTLANKQTHSHTHSHTHMHTHSHTRSTSNTYYILTCHYFARIPLSEYDHEVSTVNQRKLNSRSLTLAQKTRMTQKASAEICTIVSGPNPTPSGQLYTIRRQADGELIPIVQSPDTPPLLRKRQLFLTEGSTTEQYFSLKYLFSRLKSMTILIFVVPLFDVQKIGNMPCGNTSTSSFCKQSHGSTAFSTSCSYKVSHTFSDAPCRLMFCGHPPVRGSLNDFGFFPDQGKSMPSLIILSTRSLRFLGNTFSNCTQCEYMSLQHPHTFLCVPRKCSCRCQIHTKEKTTMYNSRWSSISGLQMVPAHAETTIARQLVTRETWRMLLLNIRNFDSVVMRFSGPPTCDLEVSPG